MNSEPPGLVRRTQHQHRRGRRGRQPDQSVEGVSNESTRQPAAGWLGQSDGKVGGWALSAAGVAGPEAAAQQARIGGHLGRKRKKDRKEGTMEEPEEERAFYTWVKRREGALRDRAGLNPKSQRTGTDST
jgi:hypothetical protein